MCFDWPALTPPPPHHSSGIPESVETTVFPLVADDTDTYVCATIVIGLVPGYPDVRPTFKLKNPRGLCDSVLDTISRSINEKLDEHLGSPVVFDLIDVVREHLTDSNLPTGQCVICLYGFQDGDQFTKTECYHYLHTYCLARHLDASKRNYDEEFNKLPGWQQLTAKPYHAACPVCREPIECDRSAMSAAAPPNDLVNAPKFRLTAEIRDLQSKMADLYLHQKERGGIIDVHAEEPQILSIDDGQEAAAAAERDRKRELESAAAEVAAVTAAAVKKPAGHPHKKNSSHYEHKHKDHHHHHKKGHHNHSYHRSHNNHNSRGQGSGTGNGDATAEPSTCGAPSNNR